MPFSEADWVTWGNHSRDLVKSYPLESLEYDLYDLNPHTWVAESFKIIEDFVYKGIVENQILSDEYTRQVTHVGEQRLIAAGYRISYLMQSLKNLNDVVLIGKQEADKSWFSSLNMTWFFVGLGTILVFVYPYLHVSLQKFKN